MLFHLIILLFLAATLYALFRGLFALMRKGSDDKKTVKALTWRIALSLSLFVFVLLAYYLGWARPLTPPIPLVALPKASGAHTG